MLTSFELRYVALRLVLAAMLIAAFSCTKDKTASVAPSSEAPAVRSDTGASSDISLSITPTLPNRKTHLLLAMKRLPGQNVQVTWYVDGSSAASTDDGGQFDCSGLTRGAIVYAAAVVRGREVRSNEVTIGDTPPELSNVTLQPVRLGQEETVEVSATASDIDDDPVTIRYQWTVNGVPAGNGPRLDYRLIRGDAVRVEVAANDGLMTGDPVVLNQTIENHPPQFIENQDYVYSGNTFVYQTQATDADGDRITYGLDGAPDGMSIDPTSGKLTWSPPSDFRGDQSVTITADDGQGSSARYTVTFTLK